MNSILLPQIAHITLCVLLYAFLTIARAPSIWGIGRNKDGSNPFYSTQPKISANLSNQFEWPIFFHIICVLLIVSKLEHQTIQIVLAWTFIGGRLLHSAVQIFSSSIRLRGIVFTINFLAVLAMWGVFFIENLHT